MQALPAALPRYAVQDALESLLTTSCIGTCSGVEAVAALHPSLFSSTTRCPSWSARVHWAASPLGCESTGLQVHWAASPPPQCGCQMPAPACPQPVPVCLTQSATTCPVHSALNKVSSNGHCSIGWPMPPKGPNPLPPSTDSAKKRLVLIVVPSWLVTSNGT